LGQISYPTDEGIKEVNVEVKLLEIRDEGTKIAAMAIKMFGANKKQRQILRFSGFNQTTPDEYLVALTYVACNNRQINFDYFEWSNSRTMKAAHSYIEEHFDDLKDGDVVDAEFILKLTDKPKKAEICRED